MRHDIKYDPSYSLLTVTMEPDEKVRAEPGAMVAHSGVRMNTYTASGGGLFKGIGRMIAGESFFTNEFTAGNTGGWVSLAPPTPGDIHHIETSPADDPIYLQGGAYIASTHNLDLDSKFQGAKGLISGEGLFFLRAMSTEGPAHLWYGSYGAIEEIQVERGQDLVVDTGHLVGFHGNVSYRIGKSGGLKSLIAGGEGLVITLSGSGTAWIQTRAIDQFAEKLSPHMPSSKK